MRLRIKERKKANTQQQKIDLMATVANESAVGKELPVSILERVQGINDGKPVGIGQVQLGVRQGMTPRRLSWYSCLTRE